jgi:hypothetical protein
MLYLSGQLDKATADSSVIVHDHKEAYCTMLISDVMISSFFSAKIPGHWGPQNNLFSKYKGVYPWGYVAGGYS